MSPGLRNKPLKQKPETPVITSQNAVQLNTVVMGMIEGVINAEVEKEKTDENKE